ncbi:hypothetical protein PIB30_029850 [Stylosanthes scabra]|uniref:Uncharacterized protein n=1 Tax=Stylosanthes scabra TaxID=79078 RepID=A0ABU6Y8L1_9FABA|nr:hypothetical protein [Stylosanthes scabra]
MWAAVAVAGERRGGRIEEKEGKSDEIETESREKEMLTEGPATAMSFPPPQKPPSMVSNPSPSPLREEETEFHVCSGERNTLRERNSNSNREREREISVELCHRSRASRRRRSWRKPRHRRKPPVKGKNTVMLGVVGHFSTAEIDAVFTIILCCRCHRVPAAAAVACDFPGCCPVS